MRCRFCAAGVPVARFCSLLRNAGGVPGPLPRPDNTSAKTLLRAAEIGREAGLNFVYAGNLPGKVDEYESTFCSTCQQALVRRNGYVVSAYNITGQGTCPSCGTKVPGRWPQDPKSVKLHGAGIPLPVR